MLISRRIYSVFITGMLLCMTRASLAADQLGVPNEGLPTDLAQLIQAIFSWSINIIGLVIFVQFFRAGFKWFTSRGNSSTIGQATEMMKNAALGAVVLFSAWLILNTINPDLVKNTFTVPALP